MKAYMCILVLTWFGQIHAKVNASKKISNDSNVKFTNEFLQLVCRDNVIPDNYKDACCSFVQRNTFMKWSRGGYYLTDYLSKLQNWHCWEYEYECKKPTFDFTPFSRLVYNRFCNRKVMMEKCAKDLHMIAVSNNFHVLSPSFGENDSSKTTENAWYNVTMSLEPIKMDIEDLNNPCVQIALFDRPSGGVGRFHEIVQPYTPFCPMTWAGYDIDSAMTRNISPWDSFSLRCRVSITVCMIVAAVLGSAVIIGNLTILSVYLSVPKLRNGQAVFKISIAAGDLLAGLIVFPNVIIFQYWMFISPRYMGSIIKLENSATNLTTELPSRLPGGGISSVVPNGYESFVGFFTTVSLFVSMYTLITATFDRFWALYRPLRYNKEKAKQYASYTCCVIWLCAVIVASIPLFVPSMQYKIILSIMVTSLGTKAVILLITAFGIPLIMLSFLNLATYRVAKRHVKVRQRLQSTRSEAKDVVEDDMEERLRKLLGLMVGVFSACMLPHFLLLVPLYLVGGLVYFYPETLNPNAAMIYQSAQYCAAFVFLSNSLWNCFIYSIRGEDFRKAARALRYVKFVTSAAAYVVSSARRLSDAPNYYRRKSSSSSGLGNGGVAASASTRLSSGNSPTPVHNIGSATMPRSNNVNESVPPIIYYSTDTNTTRPNNSERGKSKYVTADSTFGSFAIDANVDRLYLSVMENIEEGAEKPNVSQTSC